MIFRDSGNNAFNNHLADSWRDYLQISNMSKHFSETKFHRYFLDAFYYQWLFHPTLSVMTSLFLPVGHTRWFGLIGESTITPHRQYNQSGNQPGIEMPLIPSKWSTHMLWNIGIGWDYHSELVLQNNNNSVIDTHPLWTVLYILAKQSHGMGWMQW